MTNMTFKMREPKVLHLVLKGQWYDMISQGIKTEEYREVKPYWSRRLIGQDTPIVPQRKGHVGCNVNGYTHVRFHYGYASRSMLFELRDIRIGKGRKEWGAPESSAYIITLGKRCQETTDNNQPT